MQTASDATWIETQNYGLGTISFSEGVSPWGRYIYIPECPFLIFRSTPAFNKWQSLLTIKLRS
jgi:hypothetical protein